MVSLASIFSCADGNLPPGWIEFNTIRGARRQDVVIDSLISTHAPSSRHEWDWKPILSKWRTALTIPRGVCNQIAARSFYFMAADYLPSDIILM
jgi:hypothetical protein